MKTDEKYNIYINPETTFRFAFRFAFRDDDKVKHYYTPDEVDMVVLRIREGRNGALKNVLATYDAPNTWRFHMTPEETARLVPHRSYYGRIDVQYRSGDVMTLFPVNITVRPLGAVYR